jgi:glycerophosphoryl diester phosphodiesterase
MSPCLGRRILVLVASIASALVNAAGCARTDDPLTGRGFLVIAHRGNSADAPENTIASIKSAFAIGADLAEIDVRLSRDGVPVIIHDETVDRTTNGHGQVADLTIEELKRLDAGSWKDARFASERIPTLAEALTAAAGQGSLLLDVPVPNMGEVIARTLLAVGQPQSKTIIAVWNAAQLAEIHRALPHAIIAAAEGAPDVWDSKYFESQRAAGVAIFDIGNPSARFIADARAQGMPVWAWTINDEATMRQLMLDGAAGLETDLPQKALRIARELKLKR